MADQTLPGTRPQAGSDTGASARIRRFVLGVIAAGLAVLGLSTWHLVTHSASPALI